MYYIAVVNNGESKYAEHYEVDEARAMRFNGLRLQAIQEGPGWAVYAGEEPYEAWWARQTAERFPGELQENFLERRELAALVAGDSTKSVLTEPMIDDRKMVN